MPAVYFITLAILLVALVMLLVIHSGNRTAFTCRQKHICDILEQAGTADSTQRQILLTRIARDSLKHLHPLWGFEKAQKEMEILMSDALEDLEEQQEKHNE